MLKKVFYLHLYDFKLKTTYIILSFLITICISYKYKLGGLYYLTKPLLNLGKSLMFTGLTDGFNIILKICFFWAICFIFPLLFYFLLLFLWKAYFNYQIQLITMLGVFYAFIVGVLFFTMYYFISLLILFFASFESNLPIMIISLEAKINEYIYFFLSFITIFSFLLLSIGILHFINLKVSVKRKSLQIFFFFFWIFLTPPEPITQLFFFLALFFITELLLFYFYFIYFLKRNIYGESRIRTYDE